MTSQEVRRRLEMIQTAVTRLLDTLQADDEQQAQYDKIGPAVDPHFESDESVFDPTYAPSILELRNGQVFWKRTGSKAFEKDGGKLLKIFRHTYPKSAIIYAIENRKWPERGDFDVDA